jgi:hypothetical protein
MLVQLCSLPWLGFVPDDVASAPAAAVARVAETAPAGSQAMKELEQSLLDRAMEHDSPTLLFNLAREYLMAAKVIRPGVLIMAKMVGTARKAAADLTSQRTEAGCGGITAGQRSTGTA